MSLVSTRRFLFAATAVGMTAGSLSAAILTAPAAAAVTSTITPITTGSTCRYLNPTAAPTGTWSALSYADSAWRQGRSPFGHLETVGTDIGVPAKTSYYRCGFTLPTGFTTRSATLSARVDDGAVLFVNGTEVARTNLPSGTVGYGTSASTVDSYDGTRWLSWTIPAALLRAGGNVLAVEVHQNFTTTWVSGDAMLDAKLTVTGDQAPAPTTSPTSPTSPTAAPTSPTTSPTTVSAAALPTYRVSTAATPIAAGGLTWEARRGFTGGVVSSSLYAGDVLGTSDDALYRNSYYGMSAWKQAVPNGTYDVTLKMRDTYWTAAGQRVFDISAEGKPLATGLDIIAAVGRNTAYDRTFRVTVADGELTLGFTRRVDNPIVSAISVVPAPTSTTTTTTTTTTPAPTTTPTPAPTTTTTTTTSPAPAPTTTSTPSGYRLYAADEFTGTGVDGTKWKAYNNTYGDGDPTMLHCLTPNNVAVDNGSLKLTAKKQTVTCANGKVRDYTSGFLGSRDTGTYYPLYGRYEMRARVPHGQGLFPALWLRHRNGSNAAEVDIFENFFTQIPGKAMSTLHFPTTLGYNVAKKAVWYETPLQGRGGWHTFSVDIAPVTPGDDSKVTFTFQVDGVTSLQYTNTNASAWTSVDKNAAWDIALQLYVGGSWTGHPDQKLGWLPANGGICSLTAKAPTNGDPSTCPTTGLWLAPWKDSTFEIDYVRVYTKA